MLNASKIATNRTLHRLLLICCILVAFAATAVAGTATLTWNAPTSNTDSSPLTDLAGYKIYYGTAPAQYGTPIDVGLTTTYPVNNLTDGLTYYFSVTAYNASRTESGFSSEVSKSMPAASSYVLTATRSGAGPGTVTSSPAGIACGATCSAAYTAGATVTLTATASSSALFTGWTGACTGTGACTIAMNAAKTANAAFILRTFTLSATAGANGSISPSGVSSVLYGAGQTYTITAAAGYHVSDVLIDGISVGAITSYSFTNVTANHTISATFAANPFTITASASGSGSISPAGAVSVNNGASQTYTITAAATYHVSDVLVDGVSAGAITSYSFTNVTANHTISATFAANPFTITASASGSGSISPAGAVSVNNGASQTYTITPAAGYHVSDVLVDGISAGAITSYSFTNITVNHTISATFAVNPFTITASASGSGSISPAGAVSVNNGASQTFSIKPNTGYYIVGVTVDGASVGAVATYTFTNVAANHTIAATFKIKSYYSITPSAGTGGTISPATRVSVLYGGTKTFTIKPNAGYSIANVVVDGVSVGAVATYTFTNLSAKSHTINATFSINVYTITPTAGANGSLSPSGAATVAYGASQTVTITPATGYHVSDVLVDGVSAGPVASYTFANVTANHTIAAYFVNNTYTINASVSGSGGSITPANILTVPYGGNGVFTLTPDAGWHIADVLVDNTSVGPVASYTFSNISANHTISASFASNTYTITTNVRGKGGISPSGPVSANQGGNAVFSIQADAGNVITDVRVDGVSQGRVASYTFANISANHSIEAVITANLSCPDPGIPCVERVDGQPDGNNLVSGSPNVDVEFEFRAIVADTRGTPGYVRLALARTANPVTADFSHYDMTCTGDFGTGALCTYRTQLAPAVQQKFYIEAMLSDGSIATFSQQGYITGPQTDLLTDAAFTVALQPGWNSITSPYRENIDLSSVLVQKGSATPVPWLTAAANNWLTNALYDFTGSDAGRTLLAEHAGTIPDAVLIPWRTYWVFLNNTDDSYSLTFTKPLPK
jgi:hypothetical protein